MANLLRAHIRALLKEDPMGFVHDLAAASKKHGEWAWGNISKGAGRDIKRAFNKHADHQWLSTLDTVHWTDAYGLKGLTSGKDELSTTISLPGGKLEPAVWDKEVGLWIKGRITLAVNDQDRLYSGKWDDYMDAAELKPRTKKGKAQRHRQKSSGVNKLPTISKDYSRYGQLEPGNEYMEQMARENTPYVLDKSTWNPSASEPNEALVDNWRHIGIIVVDDRNGSRIEAIKYHAQNPAGAVGMVKQIFQAAKKFGVPIYDINRNKLWTPDTEIVKETVLREYIRILLMEDSASREQFAQDLYDAGIRDDRWIGDPETIPAGKERDKAMKDIMSQGRVLKKAFAKNADRAFLNNLVTVHWAYSRKSLEKLLKGAFSSRDEISTAAYLPGQIKGTGKFGKWGVLVKGHITLLANDMDQLYTGSTIDYKYADPERTKMSGANKGAQQIYEPSGYSEYKILVLDEEDWDPEVRGVDSNQNNEALVDNWAPMALIVPDGPLSNLPPEWSLGSERTEPQVPDTTEAEKWEELVEEAGLDIQVMTHKEFTSRGWV